MAAREEDLCLVTRAHGFLTAFRGPRMNIACKIAEFERVRSMSALQNAYSDARCSAWESPDVRSRDVNLEATISCLIALLPITSKQR